MKWHHIQDMTTQENNMANQYMYSLKIATSKLAVGSDIGKYFSEIHLQVNS